MGLYNALCFHALGSTIGTILNIKMFIKALNIQLAMAVPLNLCFWRLHTAIKNPVYVPDIGHYIP